MANILKNPTLSGFSPATFVTDNQGNTNAIEHPNDWEFVYSAMYPDNPHRIPQSLHRDRGFVISAGYRKWEAGFAQRGVTLRKGQRYVAKAVFMPDVNFPSGEPANLHAIQWRFWIEGGGSHAAQNWQSTGKGAYKQQEETLFVIEAAQDMNADVYFKVKSDWEGSSCDFNIHQITLEEVPADYGGSTVARLGTETSAERVVATIPSGQGPSGDIPVGHVEALSGSGQSLADVLTNDDIEVIAMGLREMQNVTPNRAVTAAFTRLAEVLERLKK